MIWTGELRGAINNLSTIVQIISPIFWGQLYSAGVARGRPGAFYFVVAAGAALQLVAAPLLLGRTVRVATAARQPSAGRPPPLRRGPQTPPTTSPGGTTRLKWHLDPLQVKVSMEQHLARCRHASGGGGGEELEKHLQRHAARVMAAMPAPRPAA